MTDKIIKFPTPSQPRTVDSVAGKLVPGSESWSTLQQTRTDRANRAAAAVAAEDENLADTRAQRRTARERIDSKKLFWRRAGVAGAIAITLVAGVFWAVMNGDQSTAEQPKKPIIPIEDVTPIDLETIDGPQLNALIQQGYDQADFANADIITPGDTGAANAMEAIHTYAKEHGIDIKSRAQLEADTFYYDGTSGSLHPIRSYTKIAVLPYDLDNDGTSDIVLAMHTANVQPNEDSATSAES
jgi:hypothetical protein